VGGQVWVWVCVYHLRNTNTILQKCKLQLDRVKCNPVTKNSHLCFPKLLIRLGSFWELKNELQSTSVAICAQYIKFSKKNLIYPQST
jgi:hypothetical protein